MPASQDVFMLEEHNQRQHVSLVPVELLSHIFVLCDIITTDKAKPKKHIQFVATAVCRRWRKVAIDTVPLWTTIYILLLKPGPCKRAELYLTRSGSTAPLDIRILGVAPLLSKETELPKLDTYVKMARKSLESIIEHGGSASRWRGLGIGVDVYASCIVLMDFLASTHLPSLETFDFSFMGPWTGHPDDEDMFSDVYGSDPAPKPLFLEPPPKLRSISIEGLMSPHLFGDISRPRIVGPTDIYISFAGFHPTDHEIYSMLAANPRLVKLCFNSGGIEEEDDEVDTDMASKPPVILSDLISLAFMHITAPARYLSFLKTFQAPALQMLELSFWVDPYASQILVDYVADGCDNSSPYFPPTLSMLSFDTVLDEGLDLEPLLRAYPNITTLSTITVAALLKRSWLVPNLVNLGTSALQFSDLKDVIFGRCGDGLPLKKVEIGWYRTGRECPLSKEDEAKIKRLVELKFRSGSPFGDGGGE